MLTVLYTYICMYFKCVHIQVVDNGYIYFPSTQGFVAPYWADADLTATGQVFYRQTNDSALLARSTREIQEAFPSSQTMTITSLFIITWYGVGYYNHHSDRVRY